MLIHGDAAFAGQGIVWECLGFSGVRGYNTGGCLHFVINNQIGFTTSPQFARSSPYPSDVAKGVQAPILHVNGDDPEAVTFACKLAIEYRQCFKRDIVIDMWCYRRFGHNEGDEPSFTQPLMYAAIRKHPRVSELYAARLEAEGVIAKRRRGRDRATRSSRTLEGRVRRRQAATRPTRPTGSAAAGAGCSKPADPETARRNVDTAIDREAVRQPRPHADHGSRRADDPQDARARARGQARDVRERRRVRLGDRRGARVRQPGDRRATGCACRARIRAAAPSASATRSWIDQTTERKYIPLTTLPHGKFEVYDSPLSANTACSASNTASRMRRSQDAGAVGSAVRRLRQRRADHDRPVHRRGRGQVAARQRPRAAAAARLRRPGARALLRPARAVPAAVRRRQPAGVQHHHARRTTSTCCAGRCCARSASRW